MKRSVVFKSIFYEGIGFLAITANLMVLLLSTHPYWQTVHLAIALWLCFIQADTKRWGEDIVFWSRLCRDWEDVCKKQREFYKAHIDELLIREEK